MPAVTLTTHQAQIRFTHTSGPLVGHLLSASVAGVMECWSNGVLVRGRRVFPWPLDPSAPSIGVPFERVIDCLLPTADCLLAASAAEKNEGRPENIAQAVLFFLENDYVTGVCLPVDGGRTVF